MLTNIKDEITIPRNHPVYSGRWVVQQSAYSKLCTPYTLFWSPKPSSQVLTVVAGGPREILDLVNGPPSHGL